MDPGEGRDDVGAEHDGAGEGQHRAQGGVDDAAVAAALRPGDEQGEAPSTSSTPPMPRRILERERLGGGLAQGGDGGHPAGPQGGDGAAQHRHDHADDDRHDDRAGPR